MRSGRELGWSKTPRKTSRTTKHSSSSISIWLLQRWISSSCDCPDFFGFLLAIVSNTVSHWPPNSWSKLSKAPGWGWRQSGYAHLLHASLKVWTEWPRNTHGSLYSTQVHQQEQKPQSPCKDRAHLLLVHQMSQPHLRALTSWLWISVCCMHHFLEHLLL
jgi:hypothetical protein